MPKTDAASVDTSLMLLREIAGKLNITQAALDTERNVVLAEERLRDVPVSHLRKSDFAFLLRRPRRRGADADRPRASSQHATPQLIARLLRGTGTGPSAPR